MISSSVESVLPPDPNPLAGYDSCNQVAFVSFVLQTGVFFGYFPRGDLDFYADFVRFRILRWIWQLRSGRFRHFLRDCLAFTAGGGLQCLPPLSRWVAPLRGVGHVALSR